MHMLKKVCLLITLFCFIFIHAAENVALTLQEPLCRAMQATGAELCRSHITGRVKISSSGGGSEELRSAVNEAALALGAPQSALQIEWRESDYQESARLSFESERGTNAVYAMRVKDQENKRKQIEIGIQIINDNPTEENIVETREKISAILQKNDVQPLIYTCLEGYLDGKLRKGVWTYCLQDAFNAVGAKLLTTTQNEHYASYTGYTPLLSESVSVGADKVNLNAAMRYNAFEGRTYVVIASPMITIEY